MKKEEPSGKETPSARSMNELMNLIMKLNEKLRERLSPRKKGKGGETADTDIVVIIMTSQEEKKPVATTRKPKPPAASSEWMGSLFKEIEKGGTCSKKSPH